MLKLKGINTLLKEENGDKITQAPQNAAGKDSRVKGNKTDGESK